VNFAAAMFSISSDRSIH